MLESPKLTLFDARETESPEDGLLGNEILLPETPIGTSEFKVTRHVKQRYLQRFLKWTKYKHLLICNRRKVCPRCPELEAEMKQELRSMNEPLCREILTRLARSTEERSFLNNTEFMSFIGEKYGYDQSITFLRDHDAVFLIKPNTKGRQGELAGTTRLRAVVTVLPIEQTVIRHMVGRTKFTKKEPPWNAYSDSQDGSCSPSWNDYSPPWNA